MAARGLKFVDSKQNGLHVVRVVKRDAQIAVIGWRYDHSGRDRNWVLSSMNHKYRYTSICSAKTAARNFLKGV